MESWQLPCAISLQRYTMPEPTYLHAGMLTDRYLRTGNAPFYIGKYRRDKQSGQNIHGHTDLLFSRLSG